MRNILVVGFIPKLSHYIPPSQNNFSATLWDLYSLKERILAREKGNNFIA
jgi:hypothetical protein